METQRQGPEVGTPNVRAAGAMAFILEVALLGAAGLWAIEALPLFPLLAMVVAAVPLVVFWAVFMSPKSKRRLPWPAHPVVAHALFLGGAILLLVVGRPWLAGIMLCLTVVGGMLAWRDRGLAAADARALAERPRDHDARRPAGRRAAR